MPRGQITPVKFLEDEMLDFNFAGLNVLANPSSDLLDNGVHDFPHVPGSVKMAFQLFFRPDRLERLNEVGRSGNFDAESADQFDSPGIHARNVWNGV